MKVPLLNFVGGPGVPLLNIEDGPGVPLINFREVPGPTFNTCPSGRLLLGEVNLFHLDTDQMTSALNLAVEYGLQ